MRLLLSPASGYAHVEGEGDVEMEGRGTARDGNLKRLICPCLAFCPPLALRHDHDQSGVAGCACS